MLTAPAHRTVVLAHRHAVPAHRHAVLAHRAGVPAHTTAFLAHRIAVPTHRIAVLAHWPIVVAHWSAVQAHRTAAPAHRTISLSPSPLLTLTLLFQPIKFSQSINKSIYRSINPSTKRGGGFAALLRGGSAPGPKAPSCVSAFRGNRSAEVCSLSVCFLSEDYLLHRLLGRKPGPRRAASLAPRLT